MTDTLHYSIASVTPYINWVYFFHAWGFQPRFATISSIHGCDACRAGWLADFAEEERAKAAEAMQLFKDANRMLSHLAEDFKTHVRFGLFDANSDDDNIVFQTSEGPFSLPLLRQQHTVKDGEPNLCLADFVRPLSQGIADKVGAFAGTVDAEMEHMYEEGDYADDFKHMLCQTLADRLAEAAVELARLNLSYTVVLATCDGVTGRKDIHEGQLVQPGQTLVDIVDGTDLWVVANYRETQLPNIHEGAEVEITADAVPGIVYKGTVESISDATGAAFSLIPQDNATGNFVKVEQRVPVRISLQGNRPEDLQRLRAGFNLECEVKY